jgi:hypothetical protein
MRCIHSPQKTPPRQVIESSSLHCAAVLLSSGAFGGRAYRVGGIVVKVLALVCSILALFCWLAGCTPKQPPSPDTTVEPKQNSDKTVIWPQIDGFERSEIHKFDDPRLGYSIAYSSANGLTATIYLYDKGVVSICDGASEVAKTELATASTDIAEATRRGQWLSMEGGAPMKSRFGIGPKSLEVWAATFKLGHRAGEVISDLFVAGRRGEFVKVRCTYLTEKKADCEQDRARLLAALGSCLSP